MRSWTKRVSESVEIMPITVFDDIDMHICTCMAVALKPVEVSLVVPCRCVYESEVHCKLKLHGSRHMSS